MSSGHLDAAESAAAPSPIQPAWDQLMNGSLDNQYVEIQGIVGTLTNRADGWTMVLLHTKSGDLKVKIARSGVEGEALEKYQSALVRLRGHLTVDRDTATQRVLSGQIKMSDVGFVVDQAAPTNMFSVTKKTAAELTRSDPNYFPFRWVRVSGQIVSVRGNDYFMMDEANGLRFRADTLLDLHPGDLVEVVGYQAALSATAPVLRGAVVRKTGKSTLPEPRRLSPDDLPNRAFDATWVRVDGLLVSKRMDGMELVLEMRSGSWRYWARLQLEKLPAPELILGSQLELTGTYRAQGEYRIMGPDVAAIDLLLNSPASIKVLRTPPWWTLQRLLILVGVLVGGLAIAGLWISQLHRIVRERTAELAVQIRERQEVEYHRAIEAERTRIAQDLHDELGSGITEIDLLAGRVKTLCDPDEKRDGYLNAMCGRTRELVSALDEIVWAMDPKHNSVDSLVSYFSIYADRFLKLAGISLDMQLPVESLEQELTTPRRHQLFLVFKEALNNVVRHSGATNVQFKIEIANEEMSVFIADNGRGLPTLAKTEGIGGMNNMSTRIQKLGGRFEIASLQSGGTMLQFSVPLG